jgi:hypothetical protein
MAASHTHLSRLILRRNRDRAVRRSLLALRNRSGQVQGNRERTRLQMGTGRGEIVGEIMSKSEQADIIVIFENIDGQKALAVAFWDFGEEAADPLELPAKNMYGVVQSLMRKGYEAFKNSQPGFESYIVVKHGVDTVKARACGKEFLDGMANDLLAEITKGDTRQ